VPPFKSGGILRQSMLTVLRFAPASYRLEPLVVLEVKLGTKRADPPELFDAIRDAVARDHGINLAAIILVRRGKLPRTSSGKVSRSSCRAAYLSNSLREVSARRGSAHNSFGGTKGATADASTVNE
jgi:hypothetical protein